MASPKAVVALESLLPHGLDGFVMGVEELIKTARARVARAINGWTIVLWRDAGRSCRNGLHRGWRRNPSSKTSLGSDMSAKLGWGLPFEVSAIHCVGVTDIGLNELVDRGLIFGARQRTDSSYEVKSTARSGASAAHVAREERLVLLDGALHERLELTYRFYRETRRSQVQDRLTSLPRQTRVPAGS